MNTITILSGVCVIYGIYGLIKGIRFYTNKEIAENFIRSSHRALIWRKIFGVEKTIKITKVFFIPLSLIVCSILILFGFFYLYLNLI